MTVAKAVAKTVEKSASIVVLRSTHILMMGTALVAACQACQHQPLPVDLPTATAEVSLALTEAPSDVSCISIITAGTVTERRNFDVSPAQATNLSLNGLVTGKTVMTVEAFNVPCRSIAGVIAGWLGGPVTIVLERGPNGRVVVSMRPNSGIGVGVDFPPVSPPKACGVVGGKCSRHSDCCSRKCTLSKLSEIDPDDEPALRFVPGQSRGICKPDEPPAPTKNRLKLERGRLSEAGGRAAFPSYDGDFLFATFPPKAAGALNPNEVFARFVRPALLASGMQRPDELLNDRSMPAGRRLGGGDFATLAHTLCNAAEQRDALSKVQCALLQNPQTADTPQLRAMERGLGISLKNLQAEIARPLEAWVFTQRVGAVPIEHHAVVATRYPGQQVTTVFGSFLNDQRVTNTIVQSGAAALRLAQPTLLAIEQLDPSDHLANQPAPVLVLLPYGADPADPAGARTALRYAYRGVLGGSRKSDAGNQPVSYTVWVDAETAELLKSVRETEDAVKTVAGSRLVRDPAAPISTCSVQYDTDDDGISVRLTNAGFKPLVAAGTPFASPSLAFDALAYAAPSVACNDRDGRAVNAFATLSHLRTSVAAAGGMDTFPQVGVAIDVGGNDNSADPVLQSLSFGRGNGPTTAPLNLCATRPTTPANQIRHGGALDGTLLAHELSHLTTAWMQKSFTEGCAPSGACPVLDPEARKRFHDFADGYAAVLSETPCIGGWLTDNGACQVLSATVGASESSALPRLLLADPLEGFAAVLPETQPAPKPVQDAFPTHRVRGRSEYADGQIVGAALWHTRQGMISQGGVAASIPLLRWLNDGMTKVGLSNSICEGDSTCDADVYRPGRELLLHLANSWANSDARASINKLLSAFARAGVFLPPYHCVDGIPNDTGGEIAGNYCPTPTDWAGDAIIDVTDQEVDEAKVKGVTQPDDDYVCRSGSPRFRIWTGPKFTFVEDPTASSNPNAPISGAATKCNTHFDVEISTDDATWTRLGGGQVPSAVTTTTDLCRAVFTPSASDFQKATAGHDVVYYRVRTWHENGGAPGVPLDERVSDQPGNGLWAASPPAISFASRLFLSDNGRPDPSVTSTCP